ncbi:hypothetical protein ANCCEY_13080 [Ancylostoma ceylanicum]|uniref:Uncharacterized protein n=1 Tax=Ancylostoma ceylanicum TaxID=53326 RepID=A0A0D6LJN1_9BILA|nr:hypothetical protein ANCCEY_13080 [Ancylostoma ceylanicum]
MEGKVLVTVLWDTEGILLVDNLKENARITEHYYANLLFQLREAIKEKRHGKLTRGILLLHDNPPVHRYVLLLEDDAVVIPMFATLLTSLIEKLDKQTHIDYVKLFHPNSLRGIPSIPMVTIMY